MRAKGFQPFANTFENRKSGSEQEAQTSAFLKDQLQNVCEVKQEFFDVYPEAYSGVFYIVPTFALLATVAYFFTAMVSLALAIVGIVVFVVQFLTNSHALDLLYPKKQSSNLTAVLPCKRQAEKRVYFVANVDATREWTLKYRMGGTMFIATLFCLLGGLLYLAVANVARWVIVGMDSARKSQQEVCLLSVTFRWRSCRFISQPILR